MGVIENNLRNTAISLSILSLILVGYLYVVNEKYKKYKYKYKSYEKIIPIIDSQLHRLCHRTRDYTTCLRAAENAQETENYAESAIKNALISASNTFAELTGVTCTSSMMLIQKDGSLKTTLYCPNVDPQRESRPSGNLSTDSGIAGEALSTGNVVSWSSGDTKFKQTRNDFAEYYNSGICIPFKSGFEYLGLLNIDSLETNKFNDKKHREIAATFGDSIALILEIKNLWLEKK